MPNVLDGLTGEFVYGNDYYQELALLALPAALEGNDLSGPVQPGGLSIVWYGRLAARNLAIGTCGRHLGQSKSYKHINRICLHVRV